MSLTSTVKPNVKEQDDSHKPPQPALKRANLTEGPINKILFRMALPMSVGLLATMSFNMADTYFVAGLGEDALAALSFTFPMIIMALAISVGLGAGTSSAVAIAAGKGDENAVRELTTDSMTLTLMITLGFSIVGFFTIEPFFKAIGASDEVLPLLHEYMSLWYLGAVFMITPMVGLTVLRALGNTKVQGTLMIAIAIANVVLDPILIYGWWIFPPLGIQGAALASLVVRVFSFVVAFYIMHKKMQLFVSPFNLLRFKSSCRKILRVSVPALGANLILPFSGFVIVALIATHGSDVVAGFGVAIRIETLILIIFYALSSVIGPFCGQNLGAGKIQRIVDSQKLSAKVCLVYGGAMAVLLALFSREMAYLFSDNALVIDTIAWYLWLVPASYGFYGIVMMVSSSFNGMAKPLPATIISSSRVIFVLLPLAWVLNSGFGLKGIFIAIATANVLLGVGAYIWIRQYFKQQGMDV